MKLSIANSVLNKYGLDLNEFLVLYLCSKDCNFDTVLKSLEQKNLIQEDLFGVATAVVSDKTKALVESINIESEDAVIKEDAKYKEVANEIRLLYPKGYKPGTTYPWRDSEGIIVTKLKALKSKFDFTFTKEEAITATQKYIDSFNGDRTYMELLKYFILKKDPKKEEYRSNFMSIITAMREGDDNESSSDWTMDLV